MKPLPQLREQIDACRPGSDDLSLPELAELARAADADRAVTAEIERSQRFDRVVSAALHDAPVPAGLADRILAAAAAARPAPRAVPISRRWMLTLAGVATVALAAITLALNWPRTPQTVSKEQLAASAEHWFDDVLKQESLKKAAWQPATKKPPAAYPFDPAVLVAPKWWRSYNTPGGPAVVFDCTPDGGQRALLFVVKSPSKFSVPTLPYSQLPGVSKGMAIGAWQKGNLLYVLVVIEDGRQKLDTLLRKPRVT